MTLCQAAPPQSSTPYWAMMSQYTMVCTLSALSMSIAASDHSRELAAYFHQNWNHLGYQRIPGCVLNFVL